MSVKPKSELIQKYRIKGLSSAERKEMSTGYRDIALGTSETFFPNNAISTTKYSYLTFLPLNIWEQFTKAANVYFLILACFQCIPGVSITNQLPTILPPLGFITFLTMIKDFYEDYKRRQSDHQENTKNILKYENGKYSDETWVNLRVGDMVKVKKNEFFPADILVIACSDFRKGICFIETKNLDGETNLKSKVVPAPIKELITSEEKALEFAGSILNSEGPNQYLSKYKGTLFFKDKKVPLSSENFLLRGCILRNTDWIMGVVVYTGHQTKIMMNSIKARPKKSTLENLTGQSVIITFILLTMFCTVAGCIYGFWEKSHEKYLERYMFDTPSPIYLTILMRIGNWILIFGNFVPISLMLTLETVKFLQGNLMSIDKGLISKHGIPCKVQSSNLNEELGQIDYVFSDKTGTLTCNEMVFKYLMVGNYVYGEQEGYTGDTPYVKNVNFSDPRVWDISKGGFQGNDAQKLRDAIMLLALCHEVVLESNGDYNASSPDELSFVYFAKLVGADFSGNDEDNNIVIKEFGAENKYTLLDVFSFNSTRKRMSSIIKDKNGKIYLYCKGADSIMIPRYDKSRMDDYDGLIANLEKFAAIGLRTLLLGMKEMTTEEYDQFKQEYDAAKNDLDNRDARMSAVEDKWETGLTLVGATAIEDRLQDEVPETIEFMRMADIKVWVLTGDKVDTAKNIGYSCKLLVHDGMELLEYPSKVKDLLSETKALKRNQSQHLAVNKKTAFLVTGHLLDTIMSPQNSHEELFKVFSDIALNSNVVLCCRVSPKQKQEIVAMVKLQRPTAITLSIGDGANDVNMITEAHVGIGIKGLEGAQAARASDFAIGEFKMLKRLLFYHGRESYRKNSNLILYNFYKNVLLCLPQFWYGFTNWFSGQTLYEAVNYQLFNITYTSLPIVLYALFDRETSDRILLSDPAYYGLGPKRLLYSPFRFLCWFGTASGEAFLIVLGALSLMDQNFSTKSGHTFGFWVFGMTCYHGVVLLSNLKILTFSNTFSPLTVSAIVASYLTFLAAWAFVSTSDLGVLEDTFKMTWININIWLYTLFIIGIALMDYCVQKIINEAFFKEYIPPTNFEEYKEYYDIKMEQIPVLKEELISKRFERTYTSCLADKLTGGKRS